MVCPSLDQLTVAPARLDFVGPLDVSSQSRAAKGPSSSLDTLRELALIPPVWLPCESASAGRTVAISDAATNPPPLRRQRLRNPLWRSSGRWPSLEEWKPVACFLECNLGM